MRVHAGYVALKTRVNAQPRLCYVFVWRCKNSSLRVLDYTSLTKAGDFAGEGAPSPEEVHASMYWRQLFSTTFWQAPIAVGCKPKGSEARKSLADLEPGLCVRFGLSAGAGMGPSALRQCPVRYREEE